MAEATATAAAAAAHHGKWYQHLYVQVLAAIGLGVLLGHFSPLSGEAMKPLGDAFIKLIKMIIAPIIFVTIVHGIAGMADVRAVGRVGIKALAYFLVVTLVALVVGLMVVNIWQPGVGMNVDPKALPASDVKEAAGYAVKAKEQGLVPFLINIIPSTVVGAFASGELLQVLLFALLFAFGLQMLGERGKPVLHFFDLIAQVLFKIVGIIMKLAPIGAFGAMAFTIGKFGLGALLKLAGFMAAFYTTCLLFIFIVLGAIAALSGFSIWKFIRYIKEELLIVLGTSSSESVLPRLMAKMENLGCRESVVGLVIPTGYSFNLDGTCIYLTMAAIFLAQATSTDLTLGQQVFLLAVLLVTSKGAAGVTGSGFIVLGGTLAALGTIPVESMALILGIDRFMSEARALTNLIGNGVATVVISNWEGALDEARMHRYLNEKPMRYAPEQVADEPEDILVLTDQAERVPEPVRM